MSKLSITIIDVGWGDSIFIESVDNSGNAHYALIDSNDSAYFRSSFIFLKKYFEKKDIRFKEVKHLFDFVMLSHAHSDHGQGLKAIMREFGTQRFYYPKSLSWGGISYLLRYCHRSNNVLHPQSVDNTKIFPNFGNVSINALWPNHDDIDEDENNNSIVLVLTLKDISFVLTGDAEKEVWQKINNEIPQKTRFFKVPHHGSNNGTLPKNKTWFNSCPSEALLGISAHIRPFKHPSSKVIKLFNSNNRKVYRTDEHYHITFQTDGKDVEVKYSHI